MDVALGFQPWGGPLQGREKQASASNSVSPSQGQGWVFYFFTFLTTLFMLVDFIAGLLQYIVSFVCQEREFRVCRREMGRQAKVRPDGR